MFNQKHIKKLVFATLAALTMQLAVASFSLNTSDERNKSNNKYSLKSLNNFSNKSLSLSGLNSSRLLKNSQIISKHYSANGVEINSMLQFDKGNTTLILPYRFKVKVPKDKITIPLK
jgi:hypothetical protein